MLERLWGNAQTKQDLTAALSSGRLANSILLVGEDGCGTGFAARCVAADYLYPQGGDPAVAVVESRGAECIEVRGEGASGQIPIARIRDIRKEISGTALSAAGRVVIIYHAERMNPASANALLKSLEEPPEGVLFILTAGSQAQLLPTILSRCGVYNIAPVSGRECADAIRQRRRDITPAQAEELSIIYEGHIGTCLDALEGHRRQSLATARQFAQLVAQRDEYAAQALVSPLEKDKPGQLLLLEDLSCLAAATLRRPSLTGLTPEQCIRLAQCAGDSQKALRSNGNSRIILTAFAARQF